MSDALFERLRHSTRSEHTALEARLSFLVGDLNASRYKELLAALYGFYLPWEDSIRPWRERLFGPDTAAIRDKTGTLIQDLTFHEIPSESLPICRSTPKVTNLPAALGNMYVMEGATLGGQILARSIEQRLGLTNGTGYCFFRSYGPKTGAMWKQFRNEMSAVKASNNDEEEMLQAAGAAFVSMREWLVESGF